MRAVIKDLAIRLGQTHTHIQTYRHTDIQTYKHIPHIYTHTQCSIIVGYNFCSVHTNCKTLQRKPCLRGIVCEKQVTFGCLGQRLLSNRLWVLFNTLAGCPLGWGLIAASVLWSGDLAWTTSSLHLAGGFVWFQDLDQQQALTLVSARTMVHYYGK